MFRVTGPSSVGTVRPEVVRSFRLGFLAQPLTDVLGLFSPNKKEKRKTRTYQVQ